MTTEVLTIEPDGRILYTGPLGFYISTGIDCPTFYCNSHVACIDVIIRDLDALKAACKVLGLEFREGQKTHKWFGRWVNDYDADDAAYRNGIPIEDYGKCLHAIGIPGNPSAYEVGVVKRPDGKGYSLVYDNFNQGYGLENIIGDNAKALRQQYAVQTSLKAARQQGYRVNQIVKDGTVQLVCTR